jgi:hypothetical protein
MLNASGEVAAAKRIERARQKLMRLLSHSPVVVEYCCYLRGCLIEGSESATEFVETPPDSQQSVSHAELAETLLSNAGLVRSGVQNDCLVGPTAALTGFHRAFVSGCA